MRCSKRSTRFSEVDDGRATPQLQGAPGTSAVKALVPGVRELVDVGVADPRAVARMSGPFTLAGNGRDEAALDPPDGVVAGVRHVQPVLGEEQPRRRPERRRRDVAVAVAAGVVDVCERLDRSPLGLLGRRHRDAMDAIRLGDVQRRRRRVGRNPGDGAERPVTELRQVPGRHALGIAADHGSV
jgi:hypothetical protein